MENRQIDASFWVNLAYLFSPFPELADHQQTSQRARKSRSPSIYVPKRTPPLHRFDPNLSHQ